MDSEPERPGDVGRDEVQPHPGHERVAALRPEVRRGRAAPTWSGSKSASAAMSPSSNAGSLLPDELVVDDAHRSAGLVDEVLRQQVVVARHGGRRLGGERRPQPLHRRRRGRGSRPAAAGRAARTGPAVPRRLAKMSKSLPNRGPACSRRQAAAIGAASAGSRTSAAPSVRPGRNSSTSAGTSGSTSTTARPDAGLGRPRGCSRSPAPAGCRGRPRRRPAGAPAARSCVAVGVDPVDVVAQPARQRRPGARRGRPSARPGRSRSSTAGTASIAPVRRNASAPE